MRHYCVHETVAGPNPRSGEGGCIGTDRDRPGPPSRLAIGLVLRTTSEFVTNAVVHAKTPPGRLIYLQFELHPDALRIEVHDTDPNRPVAHPAAEHEEAGRGLWLVSQLAAGWGCHPREGGIGKTMWALIGGVQ
ncbi:ATP-binding protein [Kitasatospora sp. NPDC101155]|uniref:ATP-binding protein n=1 Tax=Kitasatospora sp. NPDC101155 TaxID=3364097 RepID=UPI0037F5D86B